MRWYKTGDKGHIDGDGLPTLAHRYSRFAKIGGEMISLSAVENSVRTALDTPELECIATLVPDPKKDESIVLLMNPAVLEIAEPDQARKQIINHELCSLMTPKRIELVGKIPTLASRETEFITTRNLASLTPAQV